MRFTHCYWFFKVLTALLAMLCLSGCIERLFPATVGNGVARLSIRNVGSFVKPLFDDKKCGFASDLVKNNPTINRDATANSFKIGSATFKTTACVLDFGERTALSTDCLGVTTYARGKVTVSATAVYAGILTQEGGEYAAVPWPSNQVSLSLDDVEFSNYRVWTSAGGEDMLNIKGHLSADITVHLAENMNTNLCTIPIPNPTFNKLSYKPGALVSLPGPLGHFNASISGSDIHAQVGEYDGVANKIDGSIVVWGESVTVPHAGDPPGLDPKYNPEAFVKAFSCKRLNEHLKLPINGSCNAKQALAANIARFLVLDVGVLVQDISRDPDNNGGRCAQPEHWLTNLGYKTVKGVVGEQGHLTFPLGNCAIAEGIPNRIDTDCSGVETYVNGQASIVGNMVVAGTLKYHEEKIFGFIPHYFKSIDRDKPENVTFDLQSVIFNDFSSYFIRTQVAAEDKPRGQLLIHSGNMAANISPIFGENKKIPGIFGITTPVVIFNQITLQDAKTTVSFKLVKEDVAPFAGQTVSFPDIFIKSTDLQAQNGIYGCKGNYVIGSITIDEQTYVVGTAEEPLMLNPTYNQEGFDKTYTCAPDLSAPVDTCPKDGPAQ